MLRSEASAQETVIEFYRPARSPAMETARQVLSEPFAAIAAAIILVFAICAVFAPVLV
jgi:hypothetical protein